MSRILGIDPGSRVTGFGLIEGDGVTSSCIGYGTFRLGEGRSMSERLLKLGNELDRLIHEQSVEVAAVERVFVNKNADSALKLGHARGVILLSLARAGIPMFEYTPAQVKKTVTGSGRAEKVQMIGLVRAILELDEDPPEDAADALAIAMCHALIGGGRDMIDSALREEDSR